MAEILGLGWLAANELRPYPLHPLATGTDTTGTFAIPESFLVGVYLGVAAAVVADSAGFFVSAVAASPAGYAVDFAYLDPDAGAIPVGRAAIPADAAEFAAVAIVPYGAAGSGPFSDTTGRLVVGRLDEVARQPAGYFGFGYAGGRLDPDCVRPQLREVATITVEDGADVSAPLSGDIRLVAGANVRLTPVGSNGIRIDAIEGAGLNEPCACDPKASGAALPPPIRTINGVGPDALGNLRLSGDACIGVEPQPGGLRLTNACGTPCCGCPELAALQDEIAHLTTQGAMLQDLARGLQQSFQGFTANVLASRLSDGCVTC